jgi:hypothetical protein
MMATDLEKTPLWAATALQGITYWIGHRRCLYRHYPLAEGALVAEICNLIQTNLPDQLVLNCEVQYTKLLPGMARPNILTQRARVDLVVGEKPRQRGHQPRVKFIIEVKRASAPWAQINSDLVRLAAVRGAHPGIRPFMFIIAEADRPSCFVNEHGVSRKAKHSISPSGHYRVRGTWKAAHAFSKVGRAQYACLLEVYA